MQPHSSTNMQHVYKLWKLFLCLFLIISPVLFQACQSQKNKRSGENGPYVIPDSLLHTLKIDTVGSSQTVIGKETRSCLSLPSRALIFDHNRYYALVYKSRTDIRITPLRVIRDGIDSAFISAGVTKGEKVIGSEALFIYTALSH